VSDFAPTVSDFRRIGAFLEPVLRCWLDLSPADLRRCASVCCSGESSVGLGAAPWLSLGSVGATQETLLARRLTTGSAGFVAASSVARPRTDAARCSEALRSGADVAPKAGDAHGVESLELKLQPTSGDDGTLPMIRPMLPALLRCLW